MQQFCNFLHCHFYLFRNTYFFNLFLSFPYNTFSFHQYFSFLILILSFCSPSADSMWNLESQRSTLALNIALWGFFSFAIGALATKHCITYHLQTIRRRQIRPYRTMHSHWLLCDNICDFIPTSVVEPVDEMKSETYPYVLITNYQIADSLVNVFTGWLYACNSQVTILGHCQEPARRNPLVLDLLY